MEWVILFIMNWILFFLMVDWKGLKVNIWGGVFAVGMQMAVDGQFEAHQLYIIHDGIIYILGSSLFFVLGPVFVIGILFVQYHPIKRWAVILHVLMGSAMFAVTEYLLLQRKALEYINWKLMISISTDIAALGLLSWAFIVIFEKRRELRS